MPKSASFFISRILKGGRLDTPKVLAALRNSPSLDARKYAWTVVDVSESAVQYEGKRHRYLAARLVKYDPDAMVEVVDAEVRKTRLQSEPNMQQAASLFVYLPDESLICHKRVWNEIGPRDFRSQLAELIEQFHGKFFIKCELEPVSDLTVFLGKLARLKAITALKARVSPPNPLFGAFWKELREYMRQRRTQQLVIQESARAGQSLGTTVPEIAQSIVEESKESKIPAPIGDAAILMAADGYGSAEVTGRIHSQTVVVRTRDSAIHLKLDANIEPRDLAKVLVRKVYELNESRGLEHP